jgi:hypothetical protein
VEPVFAHEALNHEAVDLLCLVRLLAMTVDVKECLVVTIVVVLILFAFELELVWANFVPLAINIVGAVDSAGIGELSIATVTLKVEFVVQFMHFMALVAVQHACQTEAMGLHKLGQSQVMGSNLIDCSILWQWLSLPSSHFGLFFIASLAGVNLLVDMPIMIPALLLHILIIDELGLDLVLLMRGCNYIVQ